MVANGPLYPFVPLRISPKYLKPVIAVSGIPDGKGGYNYSVEAGDKLCFNITYQDPDYNINPNGHAADLSLYLRDPS